MIYWLSFCDPDRPRGKQFLGASLVEGANLEAAIREAWARGCNPGGEIAGVEIPEYSDARCRPRLNRLMQRDELDPLFDAMSIGEFEDKLPEVEISGACPACNGVVGARHIH